jgi:tetratricopeptide (TPR) repeat protein
MSRKRRRPPSRASATRPDPKTDKKGPATRVWPGGRARAVAVIGVILIALCTTAIYWQTVSVPPLDYEDSFYLVHSPYVRMSDAFSRLGPVWNEPYFANFHPVTTSTWLLDRTLADKSKPFDDRPFRISHLFYAALGACLLIALYRRLGIPAVLAVFGALLYAVHPIHTEVIAWLSARKDLISLIFIVLSFLAYLHARESATRNQWRFRYALTIFLALAAVLSKPVAVIVPALFIAYDFCSGPHVGIRRWRWSERHQHPVLTRTFVLTAVFLIVGVVSTLLFRSLLARDNIHGGWLIFVPLALTLPLLFAAPSEAELTAFQEGRTSGMHVMIPPFFVLSVVFAAGSAWTFWAQEQVGAIKGGLTLLPTLNLTFEALLAYAGKTLIPAHMSVSYAWNSYPYVSAKEIVGAALVCAALYMALRFAGSLDRGHRLIAFGIFWFLIALVPVSNLVPTSTKMADRYLFVPGVGAILVLLAALSTYCSSSSRRQLSVCAVLSVVVILYTGWSYRRAEVWCGKTTLWQGRPQPDLSLWMSAVETNPDNALARTSLGLAYLRLTPPDPDDALLHLGRALEISEISQSNIGGGRQLILTPVYDSLGDGYLVKGSQLVAGGIGSEGWREKKEAYINAVKYFGLASENLSGFASSDARLLSRFAEASEGQAQIDAQEAQEATPEVRDTLIRERDNLRSNSEESMHHARQILTEGNVPAIDPNYQSVILGEGNIIFGREIGASSNEEKAGYYYQALARYEEAEELLPGDPRPLLYQGLCYERLAGIARSTEEKKKQVALGELVLQKALTLSTDSPDYSPALPYRALASLYAHVNDYRSALDSLKKAQQLDPADAEASEIRTVEEYLGRQKDAR